MTDTPDALLTDEEREALAADALSEAERRALDEEVRYRVRLLAARGGPDEATAARVERDVRLLEEGGHNATVSLVRARLDV